ncbi:hypothetical protein D3C76_486970 [compost metagenome]
MAAGFAETAQFHHGLPAQTPVPRHQPWLRTQQIEVAAWANHAMQTALAVTLHLVGTHRLAAGSLGQLLLQAQQATADQGIARLQQHQPVAAQLAYLLVEVGDPVAFVDLHEMQGIACGGDRRRLAALEHDQLELPQPAGQQAVEGSLQGQVVVGQVSHHEGDRRARALVQRRQQALLRGLVRCGSGQRFEHLPGNRAAQPAVAIDTGYRLQAREPVA